MSQRNKSDSTLIPFHTLLAAPLAAGVGLVSLIPASLGTRLGAEADAWAHYRIKNLKFRLLPTTLTGPMSAGVVGGVQDTLPGTVLQVAELIPSTCMGAGQTVPTEWIKVPRLDISGPLPWYKTVAGTADTTEEYPGVLVIGGTGTDGYRLEVRGTYEFKVSVAIANTPAELALRAKMRDERNARHKALAKDRFLAILGSVATPH